ncbi:hypothetical protein [Virgibacillus salexigens]|uniref:Uncharacterized protein n=1 Tax=Virgibacillus massiliensis TaxID=1462526 RepID=A0A024QH51_9BACI|nr:hypothetical protein [Virgibacillus massiliensis]CDQ41888.1 hypothetical protein BN990_04267 [Virgibacillus massiliensis]
MITSSSRGHYIYFDGLHWRYMNGDLDDGSRSCKKCGKMPTAEGFDACLGYIEEATSACCGHGIEKPYVVYGDKMK